jgi:colanic acid/amylovoran biosynthesis protein
MAVPVARVRHVLVVNQHGDNRGDEAAMTAMLDALEVRLHPVRFTVLHQFNDPAASSVAAGHDVQFLPLAPRGLAFPRLFAGTALRCLRLPWRGVAGPVGRDVLDAYGSADLVVSAPGGPYLGDIYAWHEPLHWFYILLGWLFRRPLFLYASSAGPFEKRWMNPARRFVVHRFAKLAVREDVSARHLRALVGTRPIDLEVTIDTALGATVTPLSLDEWPGPPPAKAGPIIAVSVIDYAYRDHPDPRAAKRRHDDAVIRALSHLAARLGDAHVVFLPQVHGRHDDGPYLQRLAAQLPADISREVLSDRVPSRVHQGIFAAADVVLAGRYHPAVFSVLGAVPVACIAYEHKSIGLMEAAGLGHLVMSIDTVTAESLIALLDKVVDSAPAIREQLRTVRPLLRDRALHTADLATSTLGTRA